MAYYAKLENNIVQTVIVVSDDIENGAVWCNETFGGIWVQTFDDGSKKYAGAGDTYDPVADEFVAPVVEKPVGENNETE